MELLKVVGKARGFLAIKDAFGIKLIRGKAKVRISEEFLNTDMPIEKFLDFIDQKIQCLEDKYFLINK